MPGTSGWKADYAERFRDVDVVICTDCDGPGKNLAKRIADDLVGVAASVRVLDLASGRNDGWDLGDALTEDVETVEELRQAGELLRQRAAQVEPMRPPPKDGVVVTWANTVTRRRVDWLRPGRVPVGAVTALLGNPGVGKSLLTCAWAKDVTEGGATVLMLTAEDAADFVVRPRLEAIEAPLERIAFVSMRRSGFMEDLQLPDDVRALRAKAELHRARLIVIDPLSAHYGGAVDALKDQGVRKALAPLRRLAEDLHVAIVVLIHLNKGTGIDPLMRALGSIGQMGAVRSALLLHNDPDYPEGERGTSRVLAHVKCNFGPLVGSQHHVIEPILLDPDGKRIETARITFVGESEYSGSELLRSSQGDTGAQVGGKFGQAISYLAMALDTGPREVEAIRRATGRMGIGWRTVERAKKDLDIVAERINLEAGGQGEGLWTWRLPDPGEEEGDE